MRRRRWIRRLTLVALCALAAGAVSDASQAEPGSAESSALASRCAAAGTRSLPLLTGRLRITHRLGFSRPDLTIRFRTPRLFERCGSGFRRSVAVAVRFKPRGRSYIPVGRGRGYVQWLTFHRGFEAAGPQRAVAHGLIFGEILPCTERLVGLVRYRVTTTGGRLVKERTAPYQPSFDRCPSRAPLIPRG